MVSDSVDYPRTEYGPYLTCADAEIAARRLGVRFLLEYEWEIRDNFETTEEPISAIHITATPNTAALHTMCATCGLAAHHHNHRQAELWADVHEFEHLGHFVRLLVKTDHAGLVEAPKWRDSEWITRRVG